jgi:hypothetical protein
MMQDGLPVLAAGRELAACGIDREHHHWGRR